MKMKKFLSVLLAAMVITAAGCSGNDDAAATTTTATEAVTTTAAEAEATTTTAAEAETEATTTAAAADSPLMTDELREFIDTIRSEVPIYADYLEKSAQLPLHMGIAYEADLTGTGEMSYTSMDVYMASFDKMFISTVTDGAALDILLDGNKYYMLSAAEKAAIFMEMTEEEVADMGSSMTASIVPGFNHESATYETGETEYNGTTYLYEKITTPETGEIIVYADTATKEVMYIASAGITMEITALTSDFDNSIFTVPADYTIVDMAEMMG